MSHTKAAQGTATSWKSYVIVEEVGLGKPQGAPALAIAFFFYTSQLVFPFLFTYSGRPNMSFKGFQKSIVRAPQQFKVKFKIGEHTKDAVYTDAERRFDELEKETKKLHDESKKYFTAINGMRNISLDSSNTHAL